MANTWTKTKDRLIEAARKCDAKTIASIVTSGKVDVNVTDKAGCTAVHLCCKSADLESLGTLLDHGAKTEVFDQTGMAPLHHAAVKDYVETMALLVSYGADVDVQNKTTKMTPLHYATVNKRSRASNFLLFCGADPAVKDKDGCAAVTGMSQGQLECHDIIRNAYKESQIKICGKMIRRNGKHAFKHGLKIQNSGKDCVTFSFLCRKMLINYMEVEGATTPRHQLETVLIGDSGEIISDLYDYLVNVSASDVVLTVPVYARPTKFDDIVLRSSAGQEFPCIELVENQTGTVCSFVMTLTANGDNINTFAVVARRQKNTTMSTGETQSIHSSVDRRFGLHIPGKCLPKNTAVDLQMMPANDFTGGMNTDYIVGFSNLCTVRVNNRPRRMMTVTLPLPDTVAECDQETDNAVFLTNEETQTPTEWKEVDSCLKDDDIVEVTDPNVMNGTCVVLKVHKQRKKDFLQRVVDFLKWLYMSAIRRLKPCCFFGMSKFSSSNTWCILVGIVDPKAADDVINKWRNDNFLTSLSQKTATHLIKPNSHFIVRVLDESKAEGLCRQRLVYQRGRDDRHVFLVRGNEHDMVPFVINEVSNKLTATPDDDAPDLDSRFTTQVNVELQREKHTPTLKERSPSLQFTEYPDNRFLGWLAGELGQEWMMVGIGLGQRFSFLETIEKSNANVKRAIQTMLYTWREEADRDQDLGLTSLIHSLTRVGRRDIVSKIDTQVQELLTDKPKAHISRWVEGLTDGLDQVKAKSSTLPERDVPKRNLSRLIAPENAVSPFSEAFLLSVVSVTGLSPELLGQLNLPKSTMDGIRQTVQDPESAMFKCLLTARRRYSEVVCFFKDLFAALATDRNQEAINHLKLKIHTWLMKNTSDKEARRLEREVQKF